MLFSTVRARRLPPSFPRSNSPEYGHLHTGDRRAYIGGIYSLPLPCPIHVGSVPLPYLRALYGSRASKFSIRISVARGNPRRRRLPFFLVVDVCTDENSATPIFGGEACRQASKKASADSLTNKALLDHGGRPMPPHAD